MRWYPQGSRSEADGYRADHQEGPRRRERQLDLRHWLARAKQRVGHVWLRLERRALARPSPHLLRRRRRRDARYPLSVDDTGHHHGLPYASVTYVRSPGYHAP